MIKTIAQRTTCPRIAGGAKTTRDALRPDVELGQCVRAQTIQCGGVCATRLGSDLTTYRLEMACTTTRTLPECNCHCFPCLLCVPRLETCTLGCPPRGASSTLRDTDLFIFWGAYCLWFVPLLRMFKGTAGWRRACACARDKADESTPAHLTPTYRRAQ